MSEQPDTGQSPGKRRIWPLAAIVALMVIGPVCLHVLASRGEGVEWLRSVTHGGSVDPALKKGDCNLIKIAHALKFSLLQDGDIVQVASTLNSLQTSIFLVVMSLVLFYFYPLIPLFRRLVLVNISTLLIGVEMLMLFWMVFGGMASMGMPGLFWNEVWLSQMMAGTGVTIFCFWMFYLLFVRDFEQYRGAPDQRIWARLRPGLERSGLPRLLGRKVENAGSSEQLAWFLTYAGLPVLILLVLPGVLPVERPGNVSRVFDWPWLAGLGLGVLLVVGMVTIRSVTRFHARWQKLRKRLPASVLAVDLDPDHLDPHANMKNILLIITCIFLTSYLAPHRMRQISPPAFSICVVLGVVATFATWLSMMRLRARLAFVGVVALLLAISGGLEYEVELDDLEDWYPSAGQQLTRRLASDRQRPAGYGRVVDLADHQRSIDPTAALEAQLGPTARPRVGAETDARASREDFLERWKRSLASRSTGKPVLVVVTTSGGALRAAIWTEVVLKEIEGKVADFPRHVRLITGASGGMLGAANYVGGLVPGSPNPPPSRIGSDYLSPIAWQIAFRDFFPNSLLPWATYNRGHVLQEAWLATAPRLGLTFDKLKRLEEDGTIPSLVFSPMLVEDGRRLLISNLPLADLTGSGGGALLREDLTELRKRLRERNPAKKDYDGYDLEYPAIASISAVEFFDLMNAHSRAHPELAIPDAREKLRLASAVRMSATFPYVTSAVVLPTDPPRHVVDAGYYDNYGVNLASAWIASHNHWIRENTGGVLVVQIRAFRNEKRLKLLDEEIHSAPKPNSQPGKLARWISGASTVARFLPEAASLLNEGIQSVFLPVQGVAKARESSMYFRNDEQLFILERFFNVQQDDPDFFRTVIFTCDTLQYSHTSQNLETLNWYIESQEFDKIQKNMRTLNLGDQTGRDRNELRLEGVKTWWDRRSRPGPATPGKPSPP
ncbi:MAG: hypothetical protein JWN86_2645 [Planctomycetota bacterium]|nr:hypothetical protein [Planctomycetota bacterium]